MVNHKLISDLKAGSPVTIIAEAIPEKFAAVQEQVRDLLKSFPCKMRALMELDMIIEEIFINISKYAYTDRKGNVQIDLSMKDGDHYLTMTFRDKGKPYNPLGKETPDVSSPAEMRAIGGLGIFLVKKYSDSLSYEFSNGENRLTIVKKLF